MASSNNSSASGQADSRRPVFRKRPVSLRIISRTNGETMEYTAPAELFMNEQTVYVKYAEDEQSMGKTSTTVKISGDGIKIIRHGQVESEQEFIQGERCSGFYHAGQGNLRLDTETTDVVNRLDQGIGSISWSYVLFFDGQLAGEYEIQVQIKPL